MFKIISDFYINFTVRLKGDNKLEEKELELGSLLKKAREEKGLSLDDIQEETKIRKKYLAAIEENNFDVLPGKVYLKVFIKGYAREIGLNYQDLLEKYEVLNIKEDKESNLQKDYLHGTKVPTGSNNNERKNPFKIIFIILLILFLGAAGVYTFQYFNNSEIRLLNQESSEKSNIEESQLSEIEENEVIENTSENEEASLESAGTASDNLLNISDNDLDSFDSGSNNLLDSQEQKQISEIIILEEFNNQQETIAEETAANEVQDSDQTDSKVSDDNIQSGDQSTAETVNSANEEEIAANDAEVSENQEEVVLDNNIEISASDTVWVTVDVDGTTAFSGILEAGDRQNFEVQKRMYIKIGNGSAITAEIDGETYGPWAGDGEIAEVEFLNNGEEILINNLRD
jgi:cytoskeletal protein RodZ